MQWIPGSPLHIDDDDGDGDDDGDDGDGDDDDDNELYDDVSPDNMKGVVWV